MKKNLVNYDSDESPDPKTEAKKEEITCSNKKKIDYSQLPISNPINFRKNFSEKEDPINTFKSKEQENSLNKSRKRVFNLPEPKRIHNNPLISREKSIKPPLKLKESFFLKNTNKAENKEDDVVEDFDFMEENENSFVKKGEVYQEKDEINDEKIEINDEKVVDFLNKRDKINKKGVNIQEINGNQLLDFDWHGYRERQKIKKETSFQKKLKMPDKAQKTKHQLTYLAYEAISKQDELEDRKTEARKNHLLTQEKYGW